MIGKMLCPDWLEAKRTQLLADAEVVLDARNGEWTRVNRDGEPYDPEEDGLLPSWWRFYGDGITAIINPIGALAAPYIVGVAKVEHEYTVLDGEDHVYASGTAPDLDEAVRRANKCCAALLPIEEIWCTRR